MRKNSVMNMVQASSIPEKERVVFGQAIEVCLKQAEGRSVGKRSVKAVRLSLVADVVRSYSKRHGTAFAACRAAIIGQVSRWLRGGVYQEYAMTHLGVVRAVDLAGIEKARPTRQYSTGSLSYLGASTPQQAPISAPAPAPSKTKTKPKKPIPAANKRPRSSPFEALWFT